jgi:hypothetical protein
MALCHQDALGSGAPRPAGKQHGAYAQLLPDPYSLLSQTRYMSALSAKSATSESSAARTVTSGAGTLGQEGSALIVRSW